MPTWKTLAALYFQLRPIVVAHAHAFRQKTPRAGLSRARGGVASEAYCDGSFGDHSLIGEVFS